MTLFPAKLLLFGEYSILMGSSALSIPFRHFWASLKFISHEPDDFMVKAVASNQQLVGMCDHFVANSSVFDKFLDLRTFSEDILGGLYLLSTIPYRYGLGSSGTLCAAIYESYRIPPHDPQCGTVEKNLVSLRNSFIQMESFFHGKSSGFDPLVSFLKIPLLLDKEGDVVPADLQGSLMSENGIGLLLVDSEQSCSTGPLVANFLDEFAPDGIVTSAGTEMCSLTDSAIEKFLAGDMVGFWDEINLLSHFQMTKLNHLVPAALRPVWAEGLHSGLFSLKLCGSGGGGFLLCFTRQKEEAINCFKTRRIPFLTVSFDEPVNR